MGSASSNIGLSMSTMLVNAGLTTFQKIEERSPREIELVTLLHTNTSNPSILISVMVINEYRSTINCD